MLDTAATPVAPAAEAPVEVVQSAEAEDISLDELIGSAYDDHPELKGGHKGLPDYKKKILEHLPENGRKLVGNLRASYTQKTMEISTLKQQLESERAALARDRELMTKSEFAQKVAEQASKPLEHDAWSDEGLQERIDQKAAQMMQQMLAPLQQDLATQSRQVALDSFKTKHPDLTSDDMRMPVARLLMDRPELRLEDAYYIVKGQVAKEQSAAVKTAQRETLMKTSTGNAVRSAEAPKFKDAWTAYQWHKAHGSAK
jgi:hypothetical protein